MPRAITPRTPMRSPRSALARDRDATVFAQPSISVKLSALHPRYEYPQRRRVLAELVPSLTALAQIAKSHGIGMTIDAEEAERLELSLEIFARLRRDPALAGWEGLGLAVQAYQKRALAGDRLADRARLRMPHAHSGAAGQGRLLGHRDQARAGPGPRLVSGVHAQGAHRRVAISPAPGACSAAPAGRRAVSDVRHAQRAHRRGDRRAGDAGRNRAGRVRIPAPARHGRGAVRRDRVCRQARHRLPRLRAGRQPSGLAAVPGPAAARKRRQHFVRQSHRRRDGVDRRYRRRPGARKCARRAVRRIPRCRCRASCSRPSAAIRAA